MNSTDVLRAQAKDLIGRYYQLRGEEYMERAGVFDMARRLVLLLADFSNEGNPMPIEGGEGGNIFDNMLGDISEMNTVLRRPVIPKQ